MALEDKGISSLGSNIGFIPSFGIAALSGKNNFADEDKGVGSLEGMAAGGEVP